MSEPDIHVLYEDLATERPVVGQMRATGTGLTIEGGEVLCAIDLAGRRLLLIPSNGEATGLGSASAGISLHLADLDGQDSDRSGYLVVACEVAELADLFASVARDIVAAIRLDPTNPEKAARAVIERYRQLFARPHRKVLNERELAALMAELLVLEQLVEAGASPLAWTGAENDRHDFRAQAGAIEVKSTLSAEHRKFVVHGIRQLEAPDVGPLFLHLVRVERQLGARSVPDVVASIRVTIEGSDEPFLTLLAKQGYRLEDEDQYRAVGFSVVDQETHEVQRDFPRIVPDPALLLPDAVSRLQYTVDLAAHPRVPLGGGLAEAVTTILRT